MKNLLLLTRNLVLQKLCHSYRAARERPELRHITRDHVIWGYRLLLDRDPENEAVIDEKLAAWRWTSDLRTDFMTSSEFRHKNPDTAFSQEKTIVIKEIRPGVRLCVDLADYAVGLSIIRGTFDVDGEADFVAATLRPGQTVVDIGANIGYITVVAAAQVGAQGRVIAFEPLESNIELLQQSVAENQIADRVTVVPAALGETATTVKLVFATDALNSGGAFLWTDGDAPVPPGHTAHEVPMLRLDDYLADTRVDFIKVDVEGAEPLVLGGAQHVLLRDRPLILSEIHTTQLARVSGRTPAQFIAQIAACGYDCFLLEGGKLTRRITDLSGERAVQSVVFQPRERDGKTGLE